MNRKPREIFVDITVRSYEGRKQDLKPFVNAAHDAIWKLARKRGMFFGLIGRRGVVSRRTFTRHMMKHGFYGKS
jgi:hypothetical protein